MDQIQFSTASVVQEIDSVLAQLNDLATANDIERPEFHRQLLLHVTTLLDAQAAAIWWMGPQAVMHLAQHLNLTKVFSDRAAYCQEAKRIASVQHADSAELEFRSSKLSAQSVPLIVGGQCLGVLAVYQTVEMSAAVRDGQLRFLAAVGEILVEFEFHVKRQRQTGMLSKVSALENLVLSIHRDGSLRETAHRIANDGRVYVGCDRLSVLVRNGQQYRLLACSGTTVPERRSSLVQDLENLVAAVGRTAEPLVVPSADDRFLPPQVEVPLNAYLDRSALRSLVVVPLASEENPNQPFAAIVAEHFEQTGATESMQFVSTLSEHATISLDRATTLGRFPTRLLLGAVRPMQRLFSRDSRLRWIGALAIVLIAGYCLMMFRINFRVTVSGKLRPTNRQYVFANHDGFVDELTVRHGDRVAKTDVVATLASPDLELETKRVLGELQTQRQEFESIAAERLQLNPIDRASEQRASRLSANELATQEKIKGLEAQLQLLLVDKQRLTHRSPIDGTILDWDVVDRLRSRRIRRGQKLLEIAQLDGPWHLELAVPDHRSGHVLRSLGNHGDGLDVSFVLESHPLVTYHGSTQKIAQSTQLVDGVPCVLVEVAFDESQFDDLRPNATTVAKIHCGRRSVAFVWLHEFYEEVRRRFF